VLLAPVADTRSGELKAGGDRGVVVGDRDLRPVERGARCLCELIALVQFGLGQFESH
jgi:hypothetical protein